MSILETTEESRKRSIFFKSVLGSGEGYVCIARRPHDQPGSFFEDFFKYPEQAELMEEHISRFYPGNDLWFCPQLLARKSRTKDSVVICPNAWADLDSCEPEILEVQPTITIQSSPNRYQAYWVFDEPVTPLEAEDISRRIAYKHADDGCDKSGWDLTQLLRIPGTYNFKYGGFGVAPRVDFYKTHNDNYAKSDFDIYPQVAEYAALVDTPMPEYQDGEDLLMKHRSKIHPMAYVLFSKQPKTDWSKTLWSLETLLFESGLNADEVFAIARDSATNKYERDGRGDEILWRDVLRAEQHVNSNESDGFVIDRADPLLTDEQVALVKASPTFVERYIEWASSLGDAAVQYHQTGAFTILSALLSGSVRIPTSFGTVKPNLWFMILADTTLTRKTTAMDIAMELLTDFDADAILATDGSIEGLFTALSQRPGRPSIFLRDEFSGLLEAMTKKEYMAGMAESLTKLYDGKMQKRILRRDTIEVRDPCLILYTGGIRSRILELLNTEHVVSGFIPRFIFVCADADITKIRPVGPPTPKHLGEREDISKFLQEVNDHYNKLNTVTVNGTTTVTQKRWNATLTDEAWQLYNHFESEMVNFGMYHPQRDIIMPSLDRLSKSGLKAAVLIAATRELKDEIVITELDMLHAFYYVEGWRSWLLQVLENIGKSPYEKLLDSVSEFVERNQEDGVKRGTIMRMFKLNSRNTDEMLNTMEDRYLIKRVRNGKSENIYPPDSNTIKIRKAK